MFKECKQFRRLATKNFFRTALKPGKKVKGLRTRLEPVKVRTVNFETSRKILFTKFHASARRWYVLGKRGDN